VIGCDSILETIHLLNFRCFRDHKIHLKSLTVAVGENNAGKSTLVEALRLLSIVAERYKGLNYRDVPDWLNIPARMKGVRPSLERIGISFETIFHRYNNPPSIIKGIYSSLERIEIYIGPNEELHCVIIDRDGNPIQSKSRAQNIELPSVKILPQIGPLAKEEVTLSSYYVQRSMNTHLSSHHFRNQLHIYYNLFNRFSRLAEMSWRGLQIRSLEGRTNMPGELLSLLVRDQNFVAEVGLMGHGLQMWLQIIWFLVHSEDADTIILDEPDVYMHADLQRKLIRLLLRRQAQIIITTHSIEIMSEVNPDSILIVNRFIRESKYANSSSVVQQLIDNISGIHNIQLARLWNSRKLLLVEGKDIKILKQFHDTFYPQADLPLDIIPNMSIGGWGGWNYAIGSNMLIRNEIAEEITCFCILDSDYHTDEEIRQRYVEAQERRVQLHIWKMKEIENYLIDSEVIVRYLDTKSQGSRTIPNLVEVTENVARLCNNLENEVFDALSQEIYDKMRVGIKGANQRAREIIEQAKQSDFGLLPLVSGKKLLREISSWLVENFTISINNLELAKAFRNDEINEEIRQVIASIETNSPFLIPQ